MEAANAVLLTNTTRKFHTYVETLTESIQRQNDDDAVLPGYVLDRSGETEGWFLYKLRCWHCHGQVRKTRVIIYFTIKAWKKKFRRKWFWCHIYIFLLTCEFIAGVSQVQCTDAKTNSAENFVRPKWLKNRYDVWKTCTTFYYKCFAKTRNEMSG